MTQEHNLVSPTRLACPNCGNSTPFFRPAGLFGDTIAAPLLGCCFDHSSKRRRPLGHRPDPGRPLQSALRKIRPAAHSALRHTSLSVHDRTPSVHANSRSFTLIHDISPLPPQAIPDLHPVRSFFHAE